LVVETADNLRFHHAGISQTKLRTYASFMYQAGSWTRPRQAWMNAIRLAPSGGLCSTQCSHRLTVIFGRMS
jgi:hypothetical protein